MVVDLDCRESPRMLDSLLATGEPVIAASDNATRRSQAMARGAVRAVPADVMPLELTQAVQQELASSAGVSPRLEVIELGPLRLDNGLRHVVWHGDRILLPPRLFDLLAYLAAGPERAVPTRELRVRVWGNPWGSDDVVHQAVRRLRRALDDHGHVTNLRGHGYTFVSDEPAGLRRLRSIDGI